MSNANEAGRKPVQQFVNRLFSTDSLTTGHAYLNSVRLHKREDREFLFVSLGLQTGSRAAADGEGYEPVYTNVDVLAGPTIERSMRLLVGDYSKDSGKLFGRVQIRNLTFQPEAAQDSDRIYLNSRGILETLQLGTLEI